MTRGRPVGTARPSAASGPPIEHDGPGRRDSPEPDACDSCKIPERSEKLLTFELRLHGKPAGAWTLCRLCWEWRNPPDRQATDPLHVDEAA